MSISNGAKRLWFGGQYRKIRNYPLDPKPGETFNSIPSNPPENPSP